MFKQQFLKIYMPESVVGHRATPVYSSKSPLQYFPPSLDYIGGGWVGVSFLRLLSLNAASPMPGNSRLQFRFAALTTLK